MKKMKPKKYDNGGLMPYNPWAQQNPNPNFQYPQQPNYPQMQQPAVQNMPTYNPAPKNSVDVMPKDSTAMGSPSNPVNFQPAPGMMLGNAAQSFGAAAGQLLHDSINGGVQFLNALIPNDDRRRYKEYLPQAYNPYSQGMSGSQALYENGGHLSPQKAAQMLHDGTSHGHPLTDAQKRYFGMMSHKAEYGDLITKHQGKRGNITTTEGGESYYNPNPLPYQDIQPIPQYTPQPSFQPVHVPQYQNIDYQGGYDKNGNLTQYYPTFTGYSHHNAMTAMQSLPSTYNGYPVVNSPELYSEATQNFQPYTDSSQWSSYKFEYGGEVPEANSGIHIKPSKRGTFTAAATKHGMGVQEFAHEVLSHKDKYSSAMVKKANFARNSTKFKHEDGGKIENTNDPTYNALSKVIMERNRGKNFVDRAFNHEGAPYINNQDGTYSTHKMAYATNDDGSAMVYPTIVQNNGSLQELGPDQAYDYAMNNNEYIQTPSWKMGDYLSNRGYKNATGMGYEYGGNIPEAESGIHINPKNKGKFNATKKKTGKTTEELTHSKNPLTRKRAQFALNASHWNHKKEFGGYLAGGTYELGDDEIQALKDAGYKLSMD